MCSDTSEHKEVVSVNYDRLQGFTLGVLVASIIGLVVAHFLFEKSENYSSQTHFSGLMLCAQYGVDCARGEGDGATTGSKTMVHLSRPHSKTARSLAIAAHEIAHTKQNSFARKYRATILERLGLLGTSFALLYFVGIERFNFRGLHRNVFFALCKISFPCIVVAGVDMLLLETEASLLGLTLLGPHLEKAQFLEAGFVYVITGSTYALEPLLPCSLIFLLYLIQKEGTPAS